MVWYEGAVRKRKAFADPGLAEIHARAQVNNLSKGETRAAKLSGEECLEYVRARNAIQGYALSLDTAIAEWREAKELLKGGSLALGESYMDGWWECDALDQFFDRLAEKNKAMGSLTIAKDGNVLYTRAIGYSQIDGTEKKPLTASTRYRIGSITKTFTAAMILQLVEERKLKVTDTLDKFFPQIPNAQKITIAQILSHRSGIHDSRPSSKTNAVTKDELLTIISKGTPDFEPDAKNRYSNSGYILLGLILEKLTGKTYGEAVEERITSKLGLKDTYVTTGNIDVNKNEALTYRYPGDLEPESETHPSLLFSAGAIVSTPNDMAKFIQALFDGKIVSKESLDQMKTMRDDEGLGMVTFTFAGFKSRWTMPRSWAASSALAICSAIASASRNGTRPRDIRSASVSPSTSSRTRAWRPSGDSSTPWMAAMLT